MMTGRLRWPSESEHEGGDNTSTVTLISGVPGTGKSTFGRWAQRERGALHVDVENAGFEELGLAGSWQSICRLPPPDVTPLVRELEHLGRPVVIDWGFPLHCLPIVRALHQAGATAWWFDGDRDAARAAFIRRGTVSLGALEVQMAAIDSHMDVLHAFYENRIVEAIAPDGTFAAAKDIHERMLGGS